MMRLWILSLAFVFLSAPAFAACVAPAANAGKIMYNVDFHVAQYCDGTNWIPMVRTGKTLAGIPSLANGLVGHWKLDEASGNLIDSSGNGNTGTPSGGPAYGPNGGIVNGSLSFDGVDDRVEVGNFDVQGTGITIAGWAFANSFVNDPRIIAKASDSALPSTHDWTVIISTGGPNYLKFRLRTVNGARDNESGYVFPLNEWHHVAVTYNNATAVIDYYIDGAYVDSDTHADGGAVITGSGRDVAIGNMPASAANNVRPWDGRLDDIRVYERPLSPAEIV